MLRLLVRVACADSDSAAAMKSHPLSALDHVLGTCIHPASGGAKHVFCTICRTTTAFCHCLLPAPSMVTPTATSRSNETRTKLDMALVGVTIDGALYSSAGDVFAYFPNGQEKAIVMVSV